MTYVLASLESKSTSLEIYFSICDKCFIV